MEQFLGNASAMDNFTTLIQQGATNYWLFIPSAIALGVLHGLEPGHSKTVMAAFIIAIRGTVAQAVMLGVAATISHTAVVWAVALIGIHFSNHWNPETHEPYVQIASAFIIIAIALWMMLRTWRHTHHAHNEHHHRGDHEHHHKDFLEEEWMDPHQRAHAEEIRRRFSYKHVTTGQIILFGLTGGLVPCPASITVLLLCLQLKKLVLGATLVLCFSIGLALTMVVSGVLAALSIKHIATHTGLLEGFAHKAPYVSGVLITLVGLYVGWQGIAAL